MIELDEPGTTAEMLPHAKHKLVWFTLADNYTKVDYIIPIATIIALNPCGFRAIIETNCRGCSASQVAWRGDASSRCAQ